MTDTFSLSLTALPDIPLIQPGDNLTTIILEAVARAGMTLQDGDVLVITSKIVSKAEGCLVDLRTITPGAEAQALAAEIDKDPQLVELILRESVRISRKALHVLVVEHRLGFVSANAGIDHSNVVGNDENLVLLLPIDPDASARDIRTEILNRTGTAIGIIISDSHGRPFRLGTTGVAIGVAGMPALLDLRGQPDLFGRTLRISMLGYGDMIASSAQLLTGEGGEGLPVVLVRGLQFPKMDGHAHDLQRPAESDLYR
ncbi:MAG: coenzyme F420-0:L-glutamate ligase [Anaerolineae bacterium]|nr:coenzyme F420-0:L-glutamate ligase [Anaerolineae bacterium]